MTVFGVGPRFAFLSILYALLVYNFSADYPRNFHMGSLPASVRIVLGVLLIVPGLAGWILSGLTVIKGFKANKLCVTGVYSLCRHPLYASWPLLIAPGIVFLTNNWLALTIPLVMGLFLMMLAGDEERWLETKFKEGYRSYRKRVPFLLPLGKYR
jgi:protein-S-isoprenylcysteine O-methyltransferase Ste14